MPNHYRDHTVHAVGAVMAGLALAGCASVETPLDDGYQLGDLTGTAIEAQAQYCETADPYRRAVLIALMYRAGIDLPPGGACADIVDLIGPSNVD